MASGVLGLAFCTNVIPVDDLAAGMSRLNQWGYDAVEFWPAAFERYSNAQLRDMLVRSGLSCAQVSPSLDFTGNRAQQDAIHRLGVSFIERAMAIGAPLVRVMAGRVKAENVNDQTWQAIVNAIRRLCVVAAGHGITLALETVRDSFAETSRNALRIIDEVGQGNLRLNLQLPLRGEDIWSSLQSCGKHAMHMHIHNWQVTPSPDVPTSVLMSQITYIDAGVIDYRRFLQSVVASGFSGCISIEHGTHHGRHAWHDTAMRDGRYLRHLIGELVSQGSVVPPAKWSGKPVK
jgi:sugar phosphate isomerase/epimerase